MFAVVYHTSLSGTECIVADAATVRVLPETWGVLSWHDTREEAQQAQAEADVSA